jgi:hypothetical protein
MAIEKVINIVANTGQAAKEIKTLFNNLVETEKASQEVNDSLEDTGKAGAKGLEKVNATTEKTGGAFSKLKTAVNGLGTAFKALGIGVIIAVVAKFTQVLSENQKVVDTFNNISTAASIIITELINKFIKIIDEVNELTGGFDALGKVIGGVLKVAVNTLKVAFESIKVAILESQLAWETSFFGDSDPKTIKELNSKIKDTYKNIKDGANEIKDGAIQVGKNIGEAVGEVITGVAKVVEGGVNAISEIDAKGALAQAKSINENKKNFELLALQQQRLQLQFQRDAELQRQIRDDESKSITERIKANDELGKILDKQSKAEAGTIRARIAGLQQENSLLGVTNERTNEIFQLETDLIDLQERIAGQRSEQLTNTNSLLKEQRELTQAIKDGEAERAIQTLELEKELATRQLEKLNVDRRINEERARIAEEEIQRKRAELAEDTLARVEAEQEYLTIKQELANQSILIDRQIDDENKKLAAEQVENRRKQFEDELNARQAFEDAKFNIANAGLGLVSEIAGKSKKIATAILLIEKGLAISQVITSASRAIAQANANLASVPAFIGAVPNPAYLGQAIATAKGIATTKVSAGISIASILAQTVGKLGGAGNIGGASGGGDTGGGTPSTPSAPSFNIVQGSASNQIATSLQNRTPIQAFVVSSNVTTAQSLDRNIVQSARL